MEARDITSSFNAFMNVQVTEAGVLQVRPPTSKAGATIMLEAMIPLVVGMTACSAELSNNGTFKPVDFGVIPAKTEGKHPES